MERTGRLSPPRNENRRRLALPNGIRVERGARSGVCHDAIPDHDVAVPHGRRIGIDAHLPPVQVPHHVPVAVDPNHVTLNDIRAAEFVHIRGVRGIPRYGARRRHDSIPGGDVAVHLGRAVRV